MAFLASSTREPSLPAEPLYQVLISTDEADPVSFTVSLSENLPKEIREGFPLVSSVSYGEVITVRFHQRMAVDFDAGSSLIKQSKAIHIEAHEGKRITVQGITSNAHTSEGFLALPCDSMRNEVFTHYEYYLMATPGSNKNEVEYPSFGLIIPCSSNTIITVEPSQLVTFSGLDSLALPPSVLQAGPGAPAAHTTFTANEGATLLITNPNDLTGSTIQSNNPVVLLSGGFMCGEVVPPNIGGCGHIIEQMPPGLVLGKRFFLTSPVGIGTLNDLFHVGALINNTKIKLTCVTLLNNDPVSVPLDKDGVIDRGGFISFTTATNLINSQANTGQSYCCLDSTSPILVVQYSTGHALIGKGSSQTRLSFMTIVAPISQYLNNYTMTGASSNFPSGLISLSMAAEFFDNSPDQQQMIKLNDNRVQPTNGWIPIYCSNREICGYGAEMEVPREENSIRVYHEDPEVGLSVTYYAYQQHNLYSMLQGYELTPISGES